MKNYSNLQKTKIILLLFVSGFIYSLSSAQCDITVSEDTICIGRSISFSIPPTTTFSSIKWNFGDGVTSTQPTSTVNHSYSLPGIYMVDVRLYNSSGGITCNTGIYVHIEKPVADFDTMYSPGACAPQPVKFTDKSRMIGAIRHDSIVSWKWNFHDNKGNSSISYNKEPYHTYFSNGVFDVSLTVTTANGCIEKVTKPSFISIDGPTPKFWLYKNGKKIYTDTICVGDFVTILDSSENTDEWQFDKGDNSFFNSIGHTANHQRNIQYTKAGIYYIHLNASANVFYPTPPPGYWGDCTADYGRKDNPNDTFFTVVVLDAAQASFTASPMSGKAPVQVTFTNTSTVNSSDLLNYFWFFGDGDTSTLINPVHEYTYGAIFTAKLVIQTKSNCSGPYYIQTLNITSSIGEDDQYAQKIYPNPSSGELHIEHECLIKEISVLNAVGKIVKQQAQVQQRTYHFESLNLQRGLYLIKTQDINGKLYWSKLTIL